MIKMKTSQIAASRESGVRPRRSIVPRNVSRACKEIRAFSNLFGNQLRAWDRSLFDPITEASPEELTDELLKELRHTHRDVVALRKACEEIADKLVRAAGPTVHFG